MPPRRAPAAGHRFFADEVLLLHGRFEPAVERRIGSIQNRKPAKVVIVYCPKLRGRPGLHLEGTGQRPRHAGGDGDSRSIACHHLQQSIQPSIGRPDRAIDAGFENRLAVKMAARAVRDRHGVNHGQLVALPEIAERRKTGRQPERVVERNEV